MFSVNFLKHLVYTRLHAVLADNDPIHFASSRMALANNFESTMFENDRP